MANGRVLAARRSAPPPTAGGWEFPGGKVEPGEAPTQAIIRECREELDVAVRPVRLLGTVSDDRIRLELWHVDLEDGTPQPLQDHDELRWLTTAALDDVPWLPVDAELLAVVRPLLQ